MRDTKYIESRCFHPGVAPEYKNVHLLIILATVARRRDQELDRGVLNKHRGFSVCVSQSPDLNPIKH
jgi:hypothetical protein